jgi:hypothetical protein
MDPCDHEEGSGNRTFCTAKMSVSDITPVSEDIPMVARGNAGNVNERYVGLPSEGLGNIEGITPEDETAVDGCVRALVDPGGNPKASRRRARLALVFFGMKMLLCFLIVTRSFALPQLRQEICAQTGLGPAFLSVCAGLYLFFQQVTDST